MKYIFVLAALVAGLYAQTGRDAAPGTVASEVMTVPTYYCEDSVGTDAYACSVLPPLVSYVAGRHYTFKAGTANTGAASANFNALGVKAIKKVSGGITTDLATDDIRVGQVVDLVYDGTNMQMQSTLGNPNSGAATVVTTTAELQAAITAGSSYIIATSGTYEIATTLAIATAGVHLACQGAELLASGLGDNAILQITASNVEISGCYINGDGDGTTTFGIRAGHSTTPLVNLKIHDNKFNGSFVAVKLVKNITKSAVYDNVVLAHASTAYGIGVLPDGAFTAGPDDNDGILISNNRVYGVSADALTVDGGLSTSAHEPKNIQIIGNHVYDSGATTGVCIGWARANGGVIANNTLINCENEGIHIEDDATGVVVIGNQITGSGSAGIQVLSTAVSARPTPSNITISGNIVGNSLTGASTLDYSCIGVTGSGIVYDVTVTNNQVYECGGQSFGFATLSRANVSGNTAKNGNDNSISTASGFQFLSPVNLVFEGNTAIDDRGGSAKQEYGLHLQSVASGARIAVVHNDLTTNSVAPTKISGTLDGVTWQDNALTTSLGAELVVNGNFAADTDWTKSANWTIGGGVAHSDGAESYGSLIQNISITPGNLYKVTFTILNRVTGGAYMQLGGVAAGNTAVYSADGTYIEYIVLPIGASAAVKVFADANTFVGDVDNVSVKQVIGQ